MCVCVCVCVCLCVLYIYIYEYRQTHTYVCVCEAFDPNPYTQVEDVGGRTLGAIASMARTLLPRVLRDFVYAKCVAPNRSLDLT